MIKNIIFDFGGVLYDIDHRLSKIAFEKLGVKNFDHLYGHQEQTDLFEQLERGELREDEFRDALSFFLPNKTSNKQIDEAWSALLIGFKKERIDLLKKISPNYRLFLLSNTNIIHYKQFITELDKYTDFRSLFQDVWFSHEKQMRKPEERFYLGLIKKHRLKPEETLFIDDLDVNIEAAKKLGIQTHYLSNGQSVLDLFKLNKLVLQL